MPDNIEPFPPNRVLAQKFRQAADHLEKRNRVLQVLDVKLFLLSALNDLDRELDYGSPGKGLDDLLRSRDRPINADEDWGGVA